MRLRLFALLAFIVAFGFAVAAHASPRLDRDAHTRDDGGDDDESDDGDDHYVPQLPKKDVVVASPCARCAPDVPSVDHVVAAALATAGLDHSPSGSWVRRARWSALIPWVSVRGGRNTNWQTQTPDAVGNSLTYEVRATWRLDRLAFDGRELQVASIDAARRRERRRLATRVIRVYFTWLRAHRANIDITAAEAAAELDALTDGRFSSELH